MQENLKVSLPCGLKHGRHEQGGRRATTGNYRTEREVRERLLLTTFPLRRLRLVSTVSVSSLTCWQFWQVVFSLCVRDREKALSRFLQHPSLQLSLQLQLLQVLQLAKLTGAAATVTGAAATLVEEAAAATLSVLRTDAGAVVGLRTEVSPAYDAAQTTKQETKLKTLNISNSFGKNRPRTRSL